MTTKKTQPEDRRESALSNAKDFARLLCGDIVLLPITESGSPDFEGATRDNIEWFAGHFEELDPTDVPRLAVLTDGFSRFMDGGHDVTTLTFPLEGAPTTRQVGEQRDPVATAIIARALESDEPMRSRPRQSRKPAPAVLPWREQDAPPAAANDNRRERFSVTWFGDIADSKPKESVIKGVLGKNEFSYIVGMPGAGKSAITTDAACHVAAGLDWFGRRVESGLVVYIAAERKVLTERRMLAFRKRHGVGSIPLLVVGGRVDFTGSLADARAVVDLVKQAEVEAGAPCVWIVVDTLTRTFGAGDQNAAKDMGRFISSCDELLDKTNAHVTVIHHTGWAGERSKGAIDLDGAVDSSFIVKKSGRTFTLHCDGTNDGDDGQICTFVMESETVGFDEDGEPTTAPVIVATEGQVAGLAASLRGHAAVALETLKSLIEDRPDGVTVDDWRSAFLLTDDDAESGTMRTRFSRAKTSLSVSGHIHEGGGVVTLS